jgi:hypothetical protein
MYIADKTHSLAPMDPFKQGRVAQSVKKPVTQKVTQVCHWDENDLTGIISLTKKHKPTVTWTEAMS